MARATSHTATQTYSGLVSALGHMQQRRLIRLWRIGTADTCGGTAVDTKVLNILSGCMSSSFVGGDKPFHVGFANSWQQHGCWDKVHGEPKGIMSARSKWEMVEAAFCLCSSNSRRTLLWKHRGWAQVLAPEAIKKNDWVTQLFPGLQEKDHLTTHFSLKFPCATTCPPCLKREAPKDLSHLWENSVPEICHTFWDTHPWAKREECFHYWPVKFPPIT